MYPVDFPDVAMNTYMALPYFFVTFVRVVNGPGFVSMCLHVVSSTGDQARASAAQPTRLGRRVPLARDEERCRQFDLLSLWPAENSNHVEAVSIWKPLDCHPQIQ